MTRILRAVGRSSTGNIKDTHRFLPESKDLGFNQRNRVSIKP